MSEVINTHNLVVDFGKHKGTLWTRVPLSYLKWLSNEGSNAKTVESAAVKIAKAELERRGITTPNELVLSGHAIDRASQQLWGVFKETRLSTDEGLYSWLYRIASKLAEQGEESVTWERGCHKVRFIFKFGADHPVLVSVMRKSKDPRGWQVLKIREKLGLTQTELGQKLGVHYATVNRWEKGHFEVPGEMFSKVREIEKAFDESQDTLQ